MLTIIGAIGAIAWLALWARLRADRRQVADARQYLANKAARSPPTFDAAMVDRLPEPARRYFLYTIRPGTPLRTVCEIRTHGELGFGTKDQPSYRPMRATQILAPPHGLVWQVEAGSGLLRLSGSDAIVGESSWVRFWLANTLPVVRAGGTPDHVRAAFGRVVAESVFWAPATLLPQFGIAWAAIGDDVAQATVSHRNLEQTVTVTVDAEGCPRQVEISRWSDANPDKKYRLQPFGGYLSEFRDFDGYRLPGRVEGGNFFGTADYFPFYKVQVDELVFL